MTIFRIPDMTCGHCASTITAAVQARDPAARLEFDLGEHLVRIRSTSAADAELAGVIRAAGYSPSEVRDRTAGPARAGGCGCGCGTAKARALDLPQAAAPARGGCCS